MDHQDILDQADGSEIAIIGMACRFPGADGLDSFWDNLQRGVESIAQLSDDDLRAAGVPARLLSDPHYVKAAPILEGIELFDAAFFGYSPREADLIDPQQRLFLECAWQALEHAGYDPATYPGAIGVYGGAKTSSYLFNLFGNQQVMEALDITEIGIGNDLANLATRVSYKFNLRGPSYALHTACSTSLVAVHLACQSLLIDECQMALAGGVAINVPQRVGYLHQPGGIMSPDGHCRPFDASASGTLFGNGGGVVVLKRLEDALNDGDTIYAIIKGSATNNDGAQKASFTAPGVDGQRAVISEALANAMLKPEQISYVEAHGTGTTLGDSIEVRALTRAFRAQTSRTQFCAVGSVKSNIGHLDTAAGISSLIKTVLALRHRQLPPTLHVAQPNPQIDWPSTPFYVNTQLSDWPSAGEPRRAGVSSFGFGSTNAHVILEEAPVLPTAPSRRPWQLVLLSARSEAALEALSDNLAAHLEQPPQLSLADVAHTLQVGRRAFPQRRALVCESLEDASRTLAERANPRILSGSAELLDRPVAFMFPGQGSQYCGMARELYESEPVFRAEVDRCAGLLRPELGLDLREVLGYAEQRAESREQRVEGGEPGAPWANKGASEQASEELDQTALAQPALFVVEYALARLWQSWGIQPTGMIGHSIGEYVAATLAGVFELPDALRLVAARGRLMQRMPSGAMLAVALPEAEVAALLSDPGLALAAVNGPSQCVVAGPHAAIDALHEQLRERGVETRRLHTSHAFHSSSMDAILEPFGGLLAQVALQPPQIPFVSNLSGTWITDEQATDPRYWVQHLRQTVRFSAGLQALASRPEQVLLEAGPGHTLSTFARQHPERPDEQIVLHSLPHPLSPQSDAACVHTTLGQLWLHGVAIDWAGYAEPGRRRVALPSYPFEHQRHWIAPDAPGYSVRPAATLARQSDLADWFYLPSWSRSLPPAQPTAAALADDPQRWLIFAEAETAGTSLGAELAERLRQAGQQVTIVRPGTRFIAEDDGGYRLDPRQPADYSALLSALDQLPPERIVHCWSISADAADTLSYERFEQAQVYGFYSLLWLAQALGRVEVSAAQLTVIANQLHDVTGDERLAPAKATLLGACNGIGLEYPAISCRLIDLVLPAATSPIELLLAELTSAPSPSAAEAVIAYRGAHRWVQAVTPARLPEPSAVPALLRPGGVYLITGGLGGVGLVMAEHLARTLRARLVLVGRTGLPERHEWDSYLATHPADDATSGRVRAVRAIEALGAEVLISRADVTDLKQMRAVVAEAQARWGALHGILHAAGVPGGGLIQLKTVEAAEQVLAPKARGLLVLDALCQETPIELLVLFSSLTGVVGEFGQADYSAANAFLDAFAHWNTARRGVGTVAINWDTWHELGMAAPATVPPELLRIREQLLQGGMTAAEGVAAFDRIMAQPALPQVLVSTQDLPARIEHLHALTRRLVQESQAGALAPRPTHSRPQLQTLYVAPRNEFERDLAAIWQELLGVDQVGVHDDFFQLGGHSLLITQLLNRLYKVYPVEVPIRSLFENPTVAGMAEMLEQITARTAERDEQPLAEQVRTATAEQRPGVIRRYLRQKIAQALLIEVAQLPADGNLEHDITGISSDIQWHLHQDFRLQVYPHEIRGRPSIDALTELVTSELERSERLAHVQATSPAALYEQYEAQALAERAVPRVTLPSDQRNGRIVFLHSSPRSGSTLLRVMLAGHPALFSPPELDILRGDGMREWLRWIDDPSYGYGFYWASQGLRWAFTELLQLDDAAAKALIDELAEQDTPIPEVYARLQQLAAPRLLVDKSPSYSLSLPTLRRAEDIFDGAQYIHLVRHPYAVIESLVRLRFDKLFGPILYGSDTIDPYVVAEKVWVTCNRNLLRFMQEVDPARRHLVRYEDLVSDPEPVMRGLCSFLGLPFDPAVLQPYDRRPERMISGLGDPNILTHDRVDPRLGESWRRLRLPHRLGGAARELASEFGYELPEQAESSPAAPEDPDRMAALLETVEQLSPEEVARLIAEMEGHQGA